MAVYVNTSGQARTWLNLTNPVTGRTLHLQAGEEIDMELKTGFTDPHLQPKTSAGKSKPRKPRAHKPRVKPAAAAPDPNPTTEGEEPR